MISICMTTYNGEKYIRSQIASILNQISLDDEIIVSDNGSTDLTIDILRSFNDRRIKISSYNTDIKNKFYRITKNFENAIVQSRGEYIYLADQDDIWLEGRVEQVKKDLVNSKCIITNYKIIDEYDNVVVNQFYNYNPLKCWLLCILKFPFLGCTMAFRRDFFYEYCYPFPDKLILHDIWIGLIAYIKRELFFESSVLHCYRMHACNMTTASKGASNNSLFFKLRYRLYLYYQVFINLMRNHLI